MLGDSCSYCKELSQAKGISRDSRQHSSSQHSCVVQSMGMKLFTNTWYLWRKV